MIMESLFPGNIVSIESHRDAPIIADPSAIMSIACISRLQEKRWLYPYGEVDFVLVMR
ncbi:Unknown protein sequence [Pseudomonas amygdali pv. sesami]|nr:Unknown protein sequence [Pseudomonas amygdali pv. sesami]